MLEKTLQKYFNFSEFRPGQKEAAQALLAGKDVVALMPTGGGKSLCFQLPALLQDKLVLVVSPLIALMKDQVDGLEARGIPAAFINSSLNATEIHQRMVGAREGKIKILYLAPERFSSQGWQEFSSSIDIGILAVDEAHCVSQWGHDFRPDYLCIKDFISGLKKRPAVAALTATATPEVKKDIIAQLGLRDPEIFVRGFDRPNLKFFVQSNLKPKERKAEVLRLVKSINGSGIVYALTRKETESLVDFFRKKGIKAAAYHAGMSAGERSKIQEDFMENKYKLIAATVAFGMGVDKADIRFVIHCGMPKNLEGYYQEAGRAGRDGEKSYCILLHSKKDAVTHKYFLGFDRQNMIKQGKDPDEIRNLLNIKYDRLEKMSEYAIGDQCRRKTILEYFGDPKAGKAEENCKGCDVCLGWQKQDGEGKSAGSLSILKGEEGEADALSDTVRETVKLYKQNFSPERIAKARSLGMATIYSHLLNWYLAGGEFDLSFLISPEEERQVLRAMAEADDYQRLGAIKARLSEEISYEKIKVVVAKIKKIKI